MTELPTGSDTIQGYEAPSVTQFSVFLDNRVGKLGELTDAFEGQALTLAGFTVKDATDHAVVRLITSNAVLARRLLDREALAFSEIEVLVVELGMGKSLGELCDALLSAELNIHFTYPLLVQPRRFPAIALYADDLVLSAQILRRKMFNLFGENDLGDNAPRNTPGDPTEN